MPRAFLLLVLLVLVVHDGRCVRRTIAFNGISITAPIIRIIGGETLRIISNNDNIPVLLLLMTIYITVSLSIVLYRYNRT